MGELGLTEAQSAALGAHRAEHPRFRFAVSDRNLAEGCRIIVCWVGGGYVAAAMNRAGDHVRMVRGRPRASRLPWPWTVPPEQRRQLSV